MLQFWQLKTNAASHFKQLLKSPNAVRHYLCVSFNMRPSAGSIRYAVSPFAATTPRAPFTVGIVAFKRNFPLSSTSAMVRPAATEAAA